MGVLVISNKTDTSVNYVIDWIASFNQSFYRTGPVDFFRNSIIKWSLGNEDPEYSITFPNSTHLSTVKSIWFRTDVDKKPKLSLGNDLLSQPSMKLIEDNFQNEIRQLKRSLFGKHNALRNISEYDSAFINKLRVLQVAENVNLKIPQTIITNSKKNLIEFIDLHKSIICKALGESLFVVDKNGSSFFQYTTELSINDINEYPDSFFPTLFQQKVNKKMDVRVFFLNGKCYSMGIPKSKSVDFREDYGDHRYISFQLPREIEEKIKELMNRLELNTGSLDLLLDANEKEFYFLEINPNGQFGFLSSACNYYIEREIAKYLCYED